MAPSYKSIAGGPTMYPSSPARTATRPAMEPFQQVGASPALLLAPDDNIAVAVRDMPAGTVVRVGNFTVTLGDAVKVGH